ncbi:MULTISPECIES: hypothetical protein [unclassified Microcoleus]
MGFWLRIRHGGWGMGNWASAKEGIGHGAWGMGNWASAKEGISH